jgi:hypothetical protein
MYCVTKNIFYASKKIPLHGIQPAAHACNATQFTEILQGAKLAKLKIPNMQCLHQDRFSYLEKTAFVNIRAK